MPALKIDSSWKRTLLALAIGIMSLIIFSVFPTNNFLENLTKSLFFLLLIPFLFVKVVLGETVSNFGMRFKLEKALLLELIIFVLASVSLMYLVINYTDFPKHYSLSPVIRNSFPMFVFYELCLVNLLLLFQEYFFKGFLLSIFREKFSYFSIAIQAIIYLIPLFIVSSSIWNTIPMIIISILGGILAYRSRTFFYSYLGSLLFLIILDAYLIYLS
ncbi:MAG: hypothetical protein ACOYS2_01490 [Patescibacteria group bacterium]